MKTNPNEIGLVISGRWLFSTVQGNAHYSEILILDNESLQEFMVAPDTSITPQVDISSGNYGHGCTDFGINFDVDNYHHYDFRDGVGTSNLPQVPELPRVSEIQVRIEVDAYVDTHADDNSDSDAPNDAYQLDEMSDSGDDNDNDQQPGIEVPQNIPFYRENIPFLNNLQDRPDMYASTYESEGVGSGHGGVTYISDRAPEILQSFNDLVELHEPNAYHRFCLRHVKSNFLSNFPNKQLEGLMWQTAIQHQ
ncbi:hypothetical protein FXO37_29781 [Capsicum annuum]|nr:hypothetical protein FXO37_29781 [Capsicum annuum]